LDDYNIATPEQVNISYQLAGLGTRFLATAIDAAIQAALILILVLAVYIGEAFGASIDTLMSREWYLALIIVLVALIYYVYFFIFELLLKGRTPGKAALKIRVVRMDGRAADVPGIVIRNLIRIIDYLPIFYIVGAICIFCDKHSRRLGDIVAGTIVVQDQRRATLSGILASQAQAKQSQAVLAQTLQMPLNNDEYAIVRDYLARRKQLALSVRKQVARDIAGPICRRLGIPVIQQGDAEAFLESLLR
jgi:uncharacterized RDD family membrane protein YckC